MHVHNATVELEAMHIMYVCKSKSESTKVLLLVILVAKVEQCIWASNVYTEFHSLGRAQNVGFFIFFTLVQTENKDGNSSPSCTIVKA